MKTTGISGRKLNFAPQGGRLGLAAGAVLVALAFTLSASRTLCKRQQPNTAIHL